VTAPAFSEYEAALRDRRLRAGVFRCCARRTNFALTGTVAGRPDARRWSWPLLCQPNNPTGRTDAAPRCCWRALDRLPRDCGAVLVLDECFVPFLDDPAAGSLQDRLEAYPNLVLLRAFTKLYAMPGLRLGYAATADAALARDLLAAGQPWAVSGPAQAAGIAALREDDYVKKARALVRAERAFLLEGLRAAGAAELGGEANYLFFRSPDPALCEKLLPRGILLRDCANYRGLGPGYCRAAVRTHPENVRFLAAVQEILGNREI
jgi:threonine-phosphate decarboxylase